VLFCKVWRIGQNDCGSLVCKLLFASYGCPCLTDEPWPVWRIINPANWFLLLLMGCLLCIRLSFAAWRIRSFNLSQ
jgi:hypothetical protein